MPGFFTRLRSICRRLCIYGCLISLSLTAILVLLGWLLALRPYLQGLDYENFVYHQVRKYELESARRQNHPSSLIKDGPLAEPDTTYDKHVVDSLIKDVPQIWSHDASKPLNLHGGDLWSVITGYGKGPDHETWIYVGGTNPGLNPWLSLPLMVTRANGSCVDPPEICDAYTAAFQRLMSDYQVERQRLNSKPSFKLADCDVSPALCDHWQVNPVMMVHVKTMQPCKFVLTYENEGRPGIHYACTVTWSYVSLPLSGLPYNRMVRIGGHRVPAFPSAFEQLRSLIVYDGSVEALKEIGGLTVELYNATEIVEPQAPRIELGAEGEHDVLFTWAREAAKGYSNLRKSITG
ncbi:hypothetical protein C1H76_3353 [Elsinoe australis]|uniref:Uncharacterized protein n=1 Tax=Elsinoe australis TaxID=40998 RepID=A0A4U7B6M9_9PEZI|nr:hypothetical protein C1H76_3353 [Elsinoe australis]